MTSLAHYRSRLSGPLLDRIDLFVEMNDAVETLLRPETGGSCAAGTARAASSATPEECLAGLRRRIATVRGRLRRGCGSRSPADHSPRRLARIWGLDAAALRRLEAAREELSLSVRGVLRCMQVARTISALDDATQVGAAHVAEALLYRQESLPILAGGDAASERA
jgi:magnesium chelatase family protein